MGLMLAKTIFCVGLAGNVQVVEIDGKREFLQKETVDCDKNIIIIPEASPLLQKSSQVQILSLTKGVSVKITMPGTKLIVSQAIRDLIQFDSEGENLTITLLSDELIALPFAIEIDGEVYNLQASNEKFLSRDSIKKTYPKDSIFLFSK